MISNFRLYIEKQPEEILNLQELARKSGMKVYVEVNENFPSSFIDTMPFLASICEKFGLVPISLKSIAEEFLAADDGLLVRLNNWRHSSRPHEVTTSYLLIVAIAKKYSEDLDVEDLQKLGWHEEAAQIVLGVHHG